MIGQLARLGWLLILAGCAGGVPVERQVTVSGASFANVQGEANLNVRAFVADAEGVRREVLGALCQLDTSLYNAEFTTPSSLKLPNFGPQSPELSFSCQAGELTGAVRQRIVTQWHGGPGYWPGYGYPGYGPYGWGYGGWGYGGWGPSYPVSVYPDVAVRLR